MTQKPAAIDVLNTILNALIVCIAAAALVLFIMRKTTIVINEAPHNEVIEVTPSLE